MAHHQPLLDTLVTAGIIGGLLGIITVIVNRMKNRNYDRDAERQELIRRTQELKEKEKYISSVNTPSAASKPPAKVLEEAPYDSLVDQETYDDIKPELKEVYEGAKGSFDKFLAGIKEMANAIGFDPDTLLAYAEKYVDEEVLTTKTEQVAPEEKRTQGKVDSCVDSSLPEAYYPLDEPCGFRVYEEDRFIYPCLPIPMGENAPILKTIDSSDEWVAEVKRNGWRILLRSHQSCVFAMNRDARREERFPVELMHSIENLWKWQDTIIDCVLVAPDTLYLFDVYKCRGEILSGKQWTLQARRNLLEGLYREALHADSRIVLAEQHKTGKLDLWKRIKASKNQMAKGVIFKNLAGLYPVSDTSCQTNKTWYKLEIANQKP